MSPKAILASPMVMALLGGFLIFILRVPTVPLAQSVLSYISGLNTPLAMMTLGIYLAQSDLMALLRAKKLVCRLIGQAACHSDSFAPVPMSLSM